jgi:hypothetical protein
MSAQDASALAKSPELSKHYFDEKKGKRSCVFPFLIFSRAATVQKSGFDC